MPIQQMMLGTVAGGDGEYIDNIFDTYLRIGDGGNQTVTNNLDFGEGGFVWVKERNSNNSHTLFSTDIADVGGKRPYLITNTSAAKNTKSNIDIQFNSNGYQIQGDDGQINQSSGNKYVDWGFRKCPGFLDVVTYTASTASDGDTQTINHSLGSIPGVIMVKRTDAEGEWVVYHRSLGNDKYLRLNENSTEVVSAHQFNQTDPTASSFMIENHGSSGHNIGINGASYIAYVFGGGGSTASTARSVSFDGSNDSLEISDHSDFDISTGDFTIEFWIKPGSTTNHEKLVHCHTSGSNFGPCNFFFDNGELQLYSSSNNSSFDVVSAGTNGTFGTPSKGVWTHIACAREGNNIRIFMDGQLKGVTSYSGSLMNASSNFFIGQRNNGSYYNGKISNFRFVKGTAVYTEAFRVPTEPLANISGTSLLCCNNSSVTGSTVTPGTISKTSSPTASTDSPFVDPAEYVFGADGEHNVVAAGEYIGNGSATGPRIYLGWEPQWILIKRAVSSTASNWRLYDCWRGSATQISNGAAGLFPNLDNSEIDYSNRVELQPDGFQLRDSFEHSNYDGDTYVYIAIRRPDGYVGSEPKAGTDALSLGLGINNSSPGLVSGFDVGMSIRKQYASTADYFIASRQTDTEYLRTNSSSSAQSNGSQTFDWPNGIGSWGGTLNDYMGWQWKRAHKGFTVRAFEGNGKNPRTHAHDLNTEPEMIWVKGRDSSYSWKCWHKDLHNGGASAAPYYLELNSNSADTSNQDVFGGSANDLPTSTHWTTGANAGVNESGTDHIAYLFSSVTGFSKCGTYTGSSSSFTVTMGFQPRLFIIKGLASSRNWILFDTVTGWSKTSMDGSEGTKYLALNDNGGTTVPAVVSGSNVVCYPVSTGVYFTGLENSLYGNANANGEKYVYYAHA